MKLVSIFNKVRKKGLFSTVQSVARNYIYSRCDLYLLERPLDIRSADVPEHIYQRVVTGSENNLKIFEKHLGKYLSANAKLFKEGSEVKVILDEEGHAYAQIWTNSNGNYYDASYYKCTVPVPDDCIYQFAGEITSARRGGLIIVYLQQIVWDYFQSKGYKRTRALVDKTNINSLGVHLKLGFRETGKMLHVHRVFRIFTIGRYAGYSGELLNYPKRLTYLKRKQSGQKAKSVDAKKLDSSVEI